MAAKVVIPYRVIILLLRMTFGLLLLGVPIALILACLGFVDVGGPLLNAVLKLATILAGVAGIVGGLLEPLGLVRFSCPFCKSPSSQLIRRRRTSLYCPRCGVVEVRGVLLNRFVREDELEERTKED